MTDAKHSTFDEAAIRQLVDGFYAKVRRDPELGPVFARSIDDWAPHLARMGDFWSSVLLGTGRYKGNPMAAHVRLTGVGPELFDRWLALFDATADELFAPEPAASLREKARRIAESLRLGMFHRDELIARSAMPGPESNETAGRAFRRP